MSSEFVNETIDKYIVFLMKCFISFLYNTVINNAMAIFSLSRINVRTMIFEELAGHDIFFREGLDYGICLYNSRVFCGACWS